MPELRQVATLHSINFRVKTQKHPDHRSLTYPVKFKKLELSAHLSLDRILVVKNLTKFNFGNRIPFNPSRSDHLSQSRTVST